MAAMRERSGSARLGDQADAYGEERRPDEKRFAFERMPDVAHDRSDEDELGLERFRMEVMPHRLMALRTLRRASSPGIVLTFPGRTSSSPSASSPDPQAVQRSLPCGDDTVLEMLIDASKRKEQ
jgi:hypothetical protein